MKIQVISIGEPKLSYAKDGIKEYSKRLRGVTKLSITHIKEGKDQDKKTLKVIGDSFCVLLDEDGKEYSSQELALFLNKKEQHTASISFVVGGPDGHTAVIKERGDHEWALSKLTFPHDLALLLLLETLYRSISINNGHPYHRN